MMLDMGRFYFFFISIPEFMHGNIRSVKIRFLPSLTLPFIPLKLTIFIESSVLDTFSAS